MRRREEVVKGAAAIGTAGQVLAAVLVEIVSTRGGRKTACVPLYGVMEAPREQGVKGGAEL